MKRLISIFLTLILCISAIGITAFAAESKEITSIELQIAKYDSAVKTDAEIENAAFFVDFIAYYSDGTSAEYDSTHGWSDESITSEVSWRIAPDESLGYRQNLFILTATGSAAAQKRAPQRFLYKKSGADGHRPGMLQ